MTFCGRPCESLGVHGILWACTHYMWTAKPRLFWATTHISWAPNNDKPWAPNYVANSTHFGQPRRYRWSPTLLHWPPTKLFGQPRNVMDAQQMPSWMPTKFYGRPRELVDIHAKSWAPISRNMDGHHALTDTHDTYCGHPAHYRGRSCYADGVPRLFLGAHEKNVDFHAFRWTAATFLWTAMKLAWASTGNMWSLTHLAGSPRNVMEAHDTIVDAHHSVMGDHAALWGRIGVCGRVWMRVYTQA